MKTFIALSTLFCAVTAQASQQWEVNDVSVLFSLQSKLLGAQAKGKKGVLLPSAFFDSIKPLLPASPDAPKDEYAALKVVAARFDPCFTYATSAKCFPQVRLIWQPVEQKNNGSSTFDAGLHTFYQLTPQEWSAVTAKLLALKLKFEKLGVSTLGVPLGVHPALQNPATREAFSKELSLILLEFCGSKSLNRITFMKLFTPSIWWVFGGFEIKKGAMTKMKIPRHSNEVEEVQNFFNDDYNEPLGMKGSFTPELVNPSKKDELTELLKNYSYNFSTADGRKSVKESLATLDRIENPTIFTPETLDCAHCHVATATRAWLGARDSSFYQANQKTSYRYQGQNLQNTSGSLKNPKSIRMFGYQGTKTAIAQRVVNESFEVTKRLNLGMQTREK